MQLSTKDNKKLTDRELFQINIEFMARTYPNRHIEIRHTSYGDIVVIDGEPQFNAKGYSLLYNLQRLCKCLEGELL